MLPRGPPPPRDPRGTMPPDSRAGQMPPDMRDSRSRPPPVHGGDPSFMSPTNHVGPVPPGHNGPPPTLNGPPPPGQFDQRRDAPQFPSGNIATLNAVLNACILRYRIYTSLHKLHAGMYVIFHFVIKRCFPKSMFM